jgi:hypothetical protein
MRGFQTFTKWTRRPFRRRRTLLPAVEPLDGRRLLSAVHPIAPAATTIATVAPDFPRPDRREVRETANPRTAPRPVTLPPASTDPGPGPQGDVGSPDPDEPEQPTARDAIESPNERGETHEVAIALFLYDPHPLPRAQTRHAHRSLLSDEAAGRGMTRLERWSSIEWARESVPAIRPAPCASADESSGLSAAHPATASQVEIKRSTTAAIARRSQPTPCYYPAAADPAEVITVTWAIVFTSLTPARETIPIHAKSRGKECGIHRRIRTRP